MREWDWKVNEMEANERNNNDTLQYDGLCLWRQWHFLNSYKQLLDQSPYYYNTTGTLVLQDDNVKKIDLYWLQNALIELLPSNWNVVCLDCDRVPSAAVNNNETWYSQSLLASQHWNWGFVSHLCQWTISDEAMFDYLLVLVGHNVSKFLLYKFWVDTSWQASKALFDLIHNLPWNISCKIIII
jgi:hypothetical protein